MLSQHSMSLSSRMHIASKQQLLAAPEHVGKQTGRLKSVMMELRKCCNHPFLIDEQEWPVTRDPKQFLQQLVQASGKLALIDSMLECMKERGHRVLIYSQFTTLLDLLEEWLAARQWGYQRIDGSVSGADRQSRIDQFNRRPADNFVFLLSTKAGGLGINLASADTVIIYDSDWNPHNDLQAQARAHRLGQLKPVMIYRLAAPHVALQMTPYVSAPCSWHVNSLGLSASCSWHVNSLCLGIQGLMSASADGVERDLLSAG